jgi:cob(I)alamin adenosyltransferase
LRETGRKYAPQPRFPQAVPSARGLTSSPAMCVNSRAMKIYTRTGDDGTTGLLGAARVPKHDARVEAYGTVDELNAALGLAAALDVQDHLAEMRGIVQPALFRVGAELASADPGMLGRLERIGDEDVAALERIIDALDSRLPPLSRFVLPGGSPLAAQLHFARTVCRRAERRVTALADAGTESRMLVMYLNRLADLLFVMARVANHRAGVDETTWSGSRGA